MLTFTLVMFVAVKTIPALLKFSLISVNAEPPNLVRFD